MGKSERNKGASGEREVVHILESRGIKARRGQVFFCEPDIVTDLPVHLEVKRQETTKIHEWMRQSCDQCRGKYPSVVHRRSREGWLITMRFEDFLYLLMRKQNEKK